MVQYLKHAPMYTRDSTAAIEQTVDEMLTAIERDGDAAIRRYSRELDGWDPDDFRVPAADIERAYDSVDPSLKDDIDARARPGAALRHSTAQHAAGPRDRAQPRRHARSSPPPVQAVGSYVPGGRYPLIASRS